MMNFHFYLSRRKLFMWEAEQMKTIFGLMHNWRWKAGERKISESMNSISLLLFFSINCARKSDGVGGEVFRLKNWKSWAAESFEIRLGRAKTFGKNWIENLWCSRQLYQFSYIPPKPENSQWISLNVHSNFLIYHARRNIAFRIRSETFQVTTVLGNRIKVSFSFSIFERYWNMILFVIPLNP